MLSVCGDKSSVTKTRFMVGTQRGGVGVGDKSLFSPPLEIEEKGIERALKNRKNERPLRAWSI